MAQGLKEAGREGEEQEEKAGAHSPSSAGVVTLEASWGPRHAPSAAHLAGRELGVATGSGRW